MNNSTSLSYCIGYTTGLALLKAQAKMLDDSAMVAELVINLVTAICWLIDTAKIDTDATYTDELAAVRRALPAHHTKIAGLLPPAADLPTTPPLRSLVEPARQPSIWAVPAPVPAPQVSVNHVNRITVSLPASDPTVPLLGSLKVRDLKALAKERGIKPHVNGKAMTKAQLVHTIRASYPVGLQ